MVRKILLAVVMIGLSVLPVLLATNNIVSLSNSKTVVYIDEVERSNDQTVQKEQLEILEINIKIRNVTNLHSFTVWFNFDTEFLEFLNATEGNALNKPRNTLEITDRSHEKEKYVALSQSSLATELNSSEATLVTLEFLCTNDGRSQLAIYDSDLMTKGKTKIDHDHGAYGYCIVKEIGSIYGNERVIRIYTNFTLPADINTEVTRLFEIMADDVVLDLNGHTINQSKGTNTAIKAIDRAFTVKNGRITNFQYPIDISDCTRGQVSITNVEILNSTEAVMIKHSTGIYISNSRMSGSRKECITLDHCNFSKVSNNELSKNENYAIHMRGSYNNIICNNTISDNYGSGGIFLEDSNGSAIFNNNFVNNTDSANHTKHVHSVDSTNSWNSSYPRGGNYWDDCARADKKCGIDLNLTDQSDDRIDGPDGIVDTEYPVDPAGTSDKDYYPLKDPYGQSLQMMCDVNCTVYGQEKGGKRPIDSEINTVAVYSNSTVRAFELNCSQGKMNFTVVGGTFCKMIVSKKLLGGAITIFIDGTQITPLLKSDETHIFATFNYTGDSNRVRIEGEFGARLLENDINRDGKVNIVDISAVAKDFGKEAEVNPISGP
jgi:parallel beta-helix repeat protein